MGVLKIWTSYVWKENFKSIFLCTRCEGNFDVFSQWKKFHRSHFTYISGGKSHLTLVHKFTNHAHLFGKIHASCIMHHKSHKNPMPSSLPSVMKEFLGNSSRSWRTSFKNFVYPWTLTHTSVCMFSILLSVLFLRGWQGEFLYQSRASLVVDYFLYSCDLNVWLRGGMVRRN